MPTRGADRTPNAINTGPSRCQSAAPQTTSNTSQKCSYNTRLYVAHLHQAKFPETKKKPAHAPSTYHARILGCMLPTYSTPTWNTTPAHALSTHHARVLGCMLPTYSTPNHLKHSTSPSSEHPCKGTRLYVANLQHAKPPETQHQPKLWAPCKDTRLYVAKPQHPIIPTPRSKHQWSKDLVPQVTNLEYASSPQKHKRVLARYILGPLSRQTFGKHQHLLLMGRCESWGFISYL